MNIADIIIKAVDAIQENNEVPMAQFLFLNGSKIIEGFSGGKTFNLSPFTKDGYLTLNLSFEALNGGISKTVLNDSIEFVTRFNNMAVTVRIPNECFVCIFERGTRQPVMIQNEDGSLGLTAKYQHLLGDESFEPRAGLKAADEATVFTGMTHLLLMLYHLAKYMDDTHDLPVGIRLVSPDKKMFAFHLVWGYLCEQSHGEKGLVGYTIQPSSSNELYSFSMTGNECSSLTDEVGDEVTIESIFTDQLVTGETLFTFKPSIGLIVHDAKLRDFLLNAMSESGGLTSLPNESTTQIAELSQRLKQTSEYEQTIIDNSEGKIVKGNFGKR